MTPPDEHPDPDAGKAADDQTGLGAWQLPDELADLAGTVRRFVTPPLNPDNDYSYELKVRWDKDGQPTEETRTISVVAGGFRRVNLSR